MESRVTAVPISANPLLALAIHLLPTKLSLTLMLHCQFDHSRALLSTTRVEYGEKADMADIIGWFGEMGSGSVSAAYE